MKTQIFTDGFEGHVKRSLARAEKMRRGEKLKPERIFTFEDTETMLEYLTAKRVHLCQTVGRSG
jgi:hypothetical protein